MKRILTAFIVVALLLVGSRMAASDSPIPAADLIREAKQNKLRLESKYKNQTIEYSDMLGMSENFTTKVAIITEWH